MAETYKVLAQISPSATTLTDFYTVPALTSTVCSTLTVCNRGPGAATYRISIAIAGAADNVKQYLAYDLTINVNATQAWTIGATLATTDVIRVYSTTSNLSFNLFGAQKT